MNNGLIRDYVVSLTDVDTDEEGFLYYEGDCGYVMGISTLSRAAFFTEEEAINHMKFLLAEKESMTTDGTKYPPDFIQRGLNICDKKPKARGVLCIKRAQLVRVGDSVEVSGEIKKPVGYIYE